MFEDVFCPINNNKDGHQNGYPLFTTGLYVGPFLESGSSSLTLGQGSPLFAIFMPTKEFWEAYSNHHIRPSRAYL